MYPIDTAELKKKDVAAVIQRDLGPAALQRGNHLRWVCPFHNDHTPSLDVNRAVNRAFCNICGISLDAAGWMMKYHRMTFPEAARELLGSNSLPVVEVKVQPPTETNEPHADAQARFKTIIDYGVAQLRQSAAARAYLEARGLNELTQRFWRLGYNPRGQRLGDAWVDAGILIPDIDLGVGQTWGVKIRLLPDHPCKCQCGAMLPGAGTCPACGKKHKYRGVKGNLANLYGAYMLRRVVFMVEGEFDAQLVHQEADDLGGVCTTTAGAGKKWNPNWTARLLDAEALIVIYDQDDAGQLGAEHIRELGLGARVHFASVPDGHKDPTEYWQAGGSIFAWLRDVRQQALRAIWPDPAAHQAHLRAHVGRELPAVLAADYWADLSEVGNHERHHAG